ncbi:MAG: GMC oxidoreductase, partial [Acidimicrobiales bacterium]
TAQLAVRAGRRNSVADAYGLTTPDRPHEALVVRTRSTVDRLVFAGDRVAGVAFGNGSTIAADRVVLAAGALRSPSLLWRSGVRHRELGRSAEDHPSFVFTVALHPAARVPVDVAHPPVTAMLRWSSGDRLFGGDPGGQDQGNDLAAHVLDHVGVGADGRRFAAVIVMLASARSRGRLRLHEPGPGLRFDPGWLVHPADRRRLLAGVRHIAALLADQQLGGVAETVSIDDRGTPLAALDGMTDVEAERWLVEHPGPVSHIAATLPLDLGANRSSTEADSLGLIGDGGVVRGVAGLHVIDASVLPSLPSGNPQLPVMAVAERLSSELFR